MNIEINDGSPFVEAVTLSKGQGFIDSSGEFFVMCNQNDTYLAKTARDNCAMFGEMIAVRLSDGEICPVNKSDRVRALHKVTASF